MADSMFVRANGLADDSHGAVPTYLCPGSLLCKHAQIALNAMGEDEMNQFEDNPALYITNFREEYFLLTNKRVQPS